MWPDLKKSPRTKFAARALLAAVLALSALAATAGAVAASADSAVTRPAPVVDPSGIRGVDHAKQVVEVTAFSMKTTYATLRRFALEQGRYVPVGRADVARLGWSGLIRPSIRREGDGTTPMGVYGFVYDFGSRPDPGVTGFRWRRLTPGACWSGSRKDYNRWVRRSPCWPADEDLWSSEAVAYRYAAVIGFNYAHPIYPRGSGIFLHVSLQGPTAGCVSIRQPALLEVLRWLRPGAKIVIGTPGYLRGLKHG